MGYFGPAEFTGDLEVSMDLRLEDHAIFTLDFLNAQNKNINYGTLELDTAGSFKLGKAKGNVNFGTNTWHTVSVRNALGWQSLTVNGKLLANVTTSALLVGAEACDDSTFPYDLTGKRALGLSQGPASATTEAACKQACCAAGSSCTIYQFSQHPATSPDCWLGQSSSFEDDPQHVYQSRSRLVPGETPYHYKVALSRYIF